MSLLDFIDAGQPEASAARQVVSTGKRTQAASVLDNSAVLRKSKRKRMETAKARDHQDYTLPPQACDSISVEAEEVDRQRPVARLQAGGGQFQAMR